MTNEVEVPVVSVQVSLDTPIGGWIYRDGERVGERTIADAVVYQASSTLIELLQKEIVKEISSCIKEQILAQVSSTIENILSNPVALTNSWGELTGESLSVREHIVAEVTKQLRPSGGGYNDKPVLQKIIEEQVRQALTKELAETVKAARNKVVGSVREHAAVLIAKAVQDGLG